MSSSPSDPRVIDVVPASVRSDEPGGPRATVYTGDVGAFRRADPANTWALSRYLVARTVGDGVVLALLLVALLFLALTVLLVAVGAPTPISVLVGIVAVGWLIVWRLARAIWHRLTGGPAFDAVRGELDALVAETRPDVRRELRRIGLPAHPLAAFSLLLRLRATRRSDTTARLKRFDMERVVPAARADQLHLLTERVERRS